MNKIKLQAILGYLNIGLAIAHDSGVSLGHFGTTDFIQLAETVNQLLLSAFEPAASSTATSTASSTVATSPTAGLVAVS